MEIGQTCLKEATAAVLDFSQIQRMGFLLPTILCSWVFVLKRQRPAVLLLALLPSRLSQLTTDYPAFDQSAFCILHLSRWQRSNFSSTHSAGLHCQSNTGVCACLPSLEQSLPTHLPDCWRHFTIL